MSTDKELLTMAAKAAGISGEFDGLTGSFVPNDGFIPSSHQFYWNPLRSDGDALRLMVDLRILLRQWSDMVDAKASPFVAMRELYGNDPYAATRRAIVRAAAAIGKEMP